MQSEPSGDWRCHTHAGTSYVPTPEALTGQAERQDFSSKVPHGLDASPWAGRPMAGSLKTRVTRTPVRRAVPSAGRAATAGRRRDRGPRRRDCGRCARAPGGSNGSWAPSRADAKVCHIGEPALPTIMTSEASEASGPRPSPGSGTYHPSRPGHEARAPGRRRHRSRLSGRCRGHRRPSGKCVERVREGSVAASPVEIHEAKPHAVEGAPLPRE